MTGIEGDSAEYEYITKGVELSKDVEGMCIELGLRRGYGTKTIIDAISEYCPHKVVIAVDPYGSIEYAHREGQLIRLDYTNKMKKECLHAIYGYLIDSPVDFHFFNMEDTVFFEKFENGVDTYDLDKKTLNTYSLVHFDGPHDVKSIKKEIDFFESRTPKGGCWIFDDCTPDFYDHDGQIEPYVFLLGFELIQKGNKKALYQKL